MAGEVAIDFCRCSIIHVMRLLWAAASASASASLFVYCVTSDLVRPEP